MVQVDLVTGFLGAGKTTFIKKYIRFLKEQKISVRLIENEFGEVNVDSHLLHDEALEIADLTGLCMCCVGKDAFIKLLIRSALEGCERILVEPSGIYDVDEFFEVMSLPEVADLCEIGSIITIADPEGLSYLSDEASYLLFAQILSSGMVIMSKTQCISPEILERAVDELNELMADRGCEGGMMAELLTKSWDQLEKADFEDIMDAGYMRMVHDRELFDHASVFRSMALKVKAVDIESLKEMLEELFSSPSCGRVFRVKGFIRDLEGQIYEVNCTPHTEKIRKADWGEEKLVVIGQELHELVIRNLLKRSR